MSLSSTSSMKPLKSILRNSSTRSLDMDASSEEAANNIRRCRRAAFRRSVSFSGGCRWQECDNNSSDKTCTRPRMPRRRAGDCDYDETTSADKGLRMPIRRTEDDCEAEALQHSSSQEEPPREPLGGASPHHNKPALRMPARQTLVINLRSQRSRHPVAVRKATSFESAVVTRPTKAATHHVRKGQLRSNSAMALSA